MTVLHVDATGSLVAPFGGYVGAGCADFCPYPSSPLPFTLKMSFDPSQGLLTKSLGASAYSGLGTGTITVSQWPNLGDLTVNYASLNSSLEWSDTDTGMVLSSATIGISSLRQLTLSPTSGFFQTGPCPGMACGSFTDLNVVMHTPGPVAGSGILGIVFLLAFGLRCLGSSRSARSR